MGITCQTKGIFLGPRSLSQSQSLIEVDTSFETRSRGRGGWQVSLSCSVSLVNIAGVPLEDIPKLFRPRSASTSVRLKAVKAAPVCVVPVKDTREDVKRAVSGRGVDGRNKDATRNKGLTSSNKKLVETRKVVAWAHTLDCLGSMTSFHALPPFPGGWLHSETRKSWIQGRFCR